MFGAAPKEDISHFKQLKKQAIFQRNRQAKAGSFCYDISKGNAESFSMIQTLSESEVFKMVLTDEFVLPQKRKAKRLVSILALLSVMKTGSREPIADMVKHWY